MSIEPVNIGAALSAFTEPTVERRPGDTFVVPRGTGHQPSSSGGSILMFEPTGTLTTGDRSHGEIPAHVDVTTGHLIPQTFHVERVTRSTSVARSGIVAHGGVEEVKSGHPA